VIRKRAIPSIRAERGKFSAWVVPQVQRYRLACCDCGLVHEFQFKAVTVLSRGRKHASGRQDLWLHDLPQDQFGIRYRVKRLERATRLQRAAKKHVMVPR